MPPCLALILVGALIILGYVLLVGAPLLVPRDRRLLDRLVITLSLVVLVDLSYPFSGSLDVSSSPFQTGALAQFFHKYSSFAGGWTARETAQYGQLVVCGW